MADDMEKLTAATHAVGLAVAGLRPHMAVINQVLQKPAGERHAAEQAMALPFKVALDFMLAYEVAIAQLRSALAKVGANPDG